LPWFSISRDEKQVAINSRQATATILLSQNQKNQKTQKKKTSIVKAIALCLF
jgi:hypothetical protein